MKVQITQSESHTRLRVREGEGETEGEGVRESVSKNKIVDKQTEYLLWSKNLAPIGLLHWRNPNPPRYEI